MAKTTNISARNSSIELLRIIAMFLVMFTHANFLSGAIPFPSCESLTDGNVLNTVFAFLAQTISSPAVDLFILISGYFGIKYSRRRFLSLLFTVFFFLIVTLTIRIVIMGGVTLQDIRGLLFWGASYWFVFAYILLFVLSPVIENGIKDLQYKQFRNLLILFFSMEFLYGWVTSSAGPGYEGGHTCISFIGLYLLGRYLHLYPINCKILPEVQYSLLVLFNTLLSIILLYFEHSNLSHRLYSYCSPIIILEAVLLLLITVKRSFENKAINTIAVSAFAVYLLHNSFFINQELYFNNIRLFYGALNSFEFVGSVFIHAVAWFIAAVLLDRIRIYLWGIIDQWLSKKNYF